MSDPWVLNAQRWLNKAYVNVSGVPTVEEDGSPGWGVVNALTRALQHELGLDELSDNFGEGTLARLSAFGTLSALGPKTADPEKRRRIIKVMQAAMYCKGYDGGAGEIDGTWSSTTTSGVKDFRSDIGLSATPADVTPKLFKALLNMDAYVLVDGGQVAIRSVQRELNHKYVPSRREFFVIPADGYYSRDVQLGLMYAIQYEIGMDDDTANGYFGPGTQAGLREQGNFGEGDTGSFLISLFQAALIFNGYSIAYTRVFDAATAAATREFQQFCMLDVTGRSDFRTWASLLVSTGDPSRPATACDASKEITPARAQTLVANGYRTVGRYLTNTPVPDPLDKNIKPGELQTIFNAGMTVFPIFQEGGFDRTYFSNEKGRYGARRAHEAAAGYGFKAGTVIYFAVDFDALEEEVYSIIVPHFQGIRDEFNALGSPYGVGVYGARNTCRIVSEEGLTHLSFVSGMSTGYSGNLGYPLPTNWAFDQIREYEVGGDEGDPGWLDIDKDVQSGRDPGQTLILNTSESDAYFPERLRAALRQEVLEFCETSTGNKIGLLRTETEVFDDVLAYDEVITNVANIWGIRKALIQCVAYWERWKENLLDNVADSQVIDYHRSRDLHDLWERNGRHGPEPELYYGPSDSSTGFAQIFAETGIRAHNWAVRNGYRPGTLIDPKLRQAFFAMWDALHRDVQLNLGLVPAVLIGDAETDAGIVGGPRRDYTNQEVETIINRYNGDPSGGYGREVKRLYSVFEKFNAMAR